MSDSSDEELLTEWIPYRLRKEWADVTPLEQDDGENPVVVIDYSDRFKDVYGYFRAIVYSQEKSQRALDLTSNALRLNPANYTVWQCRRDILKALNSNLSNELDYIASVIIDNPKNYQVWHHRRVIVEWLNDPSKELELTEEILLMDAKNYHAWQHRQWAIKTYDLFENELAYTDRLISEDVRNNSAWNQRFFVLNHYGFTPEVISREIHYTMNRIRFVKNNESSWNFLRGLIKQTGPDLDQYQEVVDFAEELFTNGVKSPYLLAFLIDMYEQKALRRSDENHREYEQKVNELCDLMINEHDIIRRKYWQYVKDNFNRKLLNLNTTSTEETENSTNSNEEGSS